MHTQTSEEKRILWLEDAVKSLSRRVQSLTHKIGDPQASSGDGPLGNQDRFYRAQVTVAVGASSGAALGSGTARILQVIGTTRYKLVPDFTVTVYNDTGGGLAVNTYIWIKLQDGLFSVALADCITTSPTAAPSPP